MAAAAVSASALRTERTCDWLEELERVAERADSLPWAAVQAVSRVVVGVLAEPGTTSRQRARALELLAQLDPDAAAAAAAGTPARLSLAL